MTIAALSIWNEAKAEPCPERFNMARYVIADPARRWPDKTALIVTDGAAPQNAVETWTFAQIANAVSCAAGALLARGLERGDRVLIRVGDNSHFPIAYFGTIAAGGIAMPLSSQLSQTELSYIADDAAPRFSITDAECPVFDTQSIRLTPEDLDGEPAEYLDTHRDDPAQLVYTSGTSGSPKGVLHAQRSVWARRMMRDGWHDMREADRVMHTGAFNWTYVLGCGLSDPWSVGATAILNTGNRAPEVWPKLAAHWHPTVFAAVPGLYRRMVKYGEGLRDGFSSLRHALTAGEALSPAIHDDWLRATGKPLHEALGMSEISTFISSSPERPAPDGAMGWPQPGRHIAILGEDGAPVQRGEAGVLAVHRDEPGLMLGYWREAAQTAQAYRGEWFTGGDRCVMSSEGAIRFEGRDDDMMNAQGYRVAPQEVEAVLAAHPSVAECAVTELPVKDDVSIIAAWVVEASALDEQALRAHCAAHLASYKCPRAYHKIDALPRTANGKVQRRALTRAEL